MENLVYAIVLLPLLGFLINGLFGKNLPKIVVGSLATAMVFGSFCIAVSLFMNFNSESQPVIVKAFEWFRVNGVQINFGFQIDQLSLMMVMIITGIGSLIHLYSIGYMSHDKGFYKFFTYLNLFIFSMLLLVMGSNYLILFIGWEGVGLCSYLLIGFWYTNEEYGKAARKAFIMNRIGDLALLIGIFMIAAQTNAVDYLSVAENASKFELDGTVIIFITASLFIGATGKSAQVPLYTWLPDAMAGPTPVSALIHAATMVTAGIYLVVRSNFLFTLAPTVQGGILFIGFLTAALAGFYALRQNDIKKVLAYSTVSQLGFMFIALGLGAYTTAMFHVMTHAFFKALLFLGAGSVIHAMSNEQDMRFMGGLKKYIPLTHATFLIGTLAISGFPLLSGMISKDEILVAAFAKNPIYWVILFVLAAMTATYMFRLYYLTFHGEFRGTEEQKHHLHESPSNMTLPLIVLAILSVIGGFINLPHFIGHGHYAKLMEWLKPVLTEQSYSQMEATLSGVDFNTEMILLAATVIMFFSVWFIVRNTYVNKKKMAVAEENYTGWEKLSAKKLYVDELYNALIVKTVEGLGRGGKMFDKGILDRFVNFVGDGAEDSGKAMKRVQNGNVETYILIMSLAVGIILIVNFLLQ
ncbi:NADH-quinone oxidoreductase subunit L [Chryseobacterium indologenes]|uniref:NADH-quinone oxidoreductase subunit L n=1 Tax=Chryseobacterium indologenes TaxID=253 RepID=A0A1Z3W8U3_CHRID|nr:NADH-quinone oxidoreductase subunit L [Chryseobacterium indologenes]ASE63927.1 NADH-quinone oxidoreductase subunit L [Chryseobacterium indologenes]ATN03989.1 NADH-quinone oxidoreductase subunit L [Chryseobacterium indologenes]AYY83346.1 NADH-quinone oxidoreductase subunit L [Chryseobacterium indologenes]AYZ37156.1 NADH-quinone oxidoreductase subunit L [Chryseobacterium indologenes]AZB19704.1 NADH-quinone oxidoreductase subunit L [Chryseobacterium indologenes]